MAGVVAADGDRLTTISIWESFKQRLDSLKLTESQSYQDILVALADYFESKGKRGESALRRP